MKLTAFEIKAIQSADLNSSGGVEQQIEDNATALDVNDVCDACDITPSEARGVLSSLVKKGLIELDDDSCEDFFGKKKTPVFWLTEEGIRTRFNLDANETGKA